MSRTARVRQLAAASANALRAASYDRLGRVPSSPLMVFVELTRRCNMKCRHCDIWKTGGRNVERVTRPALSEVEGNAGLPTGPSGRGAEREEARLPSQERAGESEVPGDVLVELLAGLVPKGLLAVDLFGGEPLLREDLPEIVRGLSRAGLHVTVTTNGLLLDRERASALVASGLRQLLVSLDGPDAATHDGLRGRKGAFDAARAGIGHYLAAGGRRLGLNMLVCKLNFMQVDQMAELAHSLGARQVRLLPYHQCYPFNQYGQDDSLLPAAEDLPALEEALGRFRSKAGRLRIETNSPSYLAGIGRHFGPGQGEARAPVRCMAGLGVCDLNAFGDLFPCYTLFRRVGNVMRTSFAELWRSQAMTRYREETRDCAACWQSCYIEPGLRLSLRALAADWRSFLRDVRQYGS